MSSAADLTDTFIARQAIHMKYQALFCLKNNTYFKMLSAAALTGILRVNLQFISRIPNANCEESDMPSHSVNTPIQIYRKFHLEKLKIFR